jgi:hypothetical protein
MALPVGLHAAARKLASGTTEGVAIDGQPVKLTHSYAMAQPSPFLPDQMDIVVLLADTPLARRRCRWGRKTSPTTRR